jgi:hypothetical protein
MEEGGAEEILPPSTADKAEETTHGFALHGDAHLQIVPPSSIYSPTEDQYDRMRWLFDNFGDKAGAIVITPADRANTDAWLRQKCATHLAGYSSDVGRRAVDGTLDWAECATRNNQEDGSAHGTRRFTRLSNLFDKVLPGKAADFARADDVAEAKARAERAVQDARLEKRLTGVHGGSNNRTGRSSKSAIWDSYISEEN